MRFLFNNNTNTIPSGNSYALARRNTRESSKQSTVNKSENNASETQNEVSANTVIQPPAPQFTDTQAKQLGFANVKELDEAINQAIGKDPAKATLIRTNLQTILENPEQAEQFANAVQIYQKSGRDVSEIFEKLSNSELKDYDFLNELSVEVTHINLGEKSTPEIRTLADNFFEAQTQENNGQLGFDAQANQVFGKYDTQSKPGFIGFLNEYRATADLETFQTNLRSIGINLTKTDVEQLQSGVANTATIAEENGDEETLLWAQKMNDGITNFAKERGWDDIVKRGEEIGKMITTALDNIAKQEANNLAAERGLVGEIINIDKENIGVSETTQKDIQKAVQDIIKTKAEETEKQEKLAEARNNDKDSIKELDKKILENNEKNKYSHLPAWLQYIVAASRRYAA